MAGALGEGDGGIGEADADLDAAQREEAKDVHDERRRAPIADVVLHRGSGAVVVSEAKAQKRCGDGVTCFEGLHEQAAVEPEHGGPVAGGALGKEDDGDAGVGCGLHSAGRAGCGAAASALHVDRAGHGRHPAEEGPTADFRLGDEDARMQSCKRDNVEVAEVVRDHYAALGKSALAANGDAHRAHTSRAESMQPFCLLLAGRGPFDNEFQCARCE